MKKLLLIINPFSGKMKAKTSLFSVITTFSTNEYLVTVKPTEYSGHATEIAEKYSKDFDLVVCCGGDGTLNEVVQGIMQSGTNVNLGYIPAGSTNDLANSLNLSKDLIKATEFIVHNKPKKYDLGLFDGSKYFNYVASFGAFTETSYNTSQSMKNTFGHIAYLLEGAKSLGKIYSFDIKINYDGNVMVDEFIFGAVMNTTSIGGIMRLDNPSIKFNDGLFEILLIKNPENIATLTNTINALVTQSFNSDDIVFLKASNIVFECDSALNWSIDGEQYKADNIVDIRIVNSALNLIY